LLLIELAEPTRAAALRMAFVHENGNTAKADGILATLVSGLGLAVPKVYGRSKRAA
jgi:hypothetical protein